VHPNFSVSEIRAGFVVNSGTGAGFSPSSSVSSASHYSSTAAGTVGPLEATVTRDLVSAQFPRWCSGECSVKNWSPASVETETECALGMQACCRS
jgi:hypothetical protein